MGKVKVNVKKMTKLTKPKRKVKQATVQRRSSQPNFGPVSAIDTAPVAIGNSIRGSQSQIVQSKTGVVVRSRDFMFPATATGSIQTWTMCGGTPITPAVFSDSTLRNYMQMYQKYRWRRLTAHYITSSATTATGDIMFYHQKNRESVFLNQTSTQLLPFVLNDDDTVIGPQWTNHSVELHIQGTWKSTDYGMTSEVQAYADGDLFLLSKTSTTDSPGYVLFDYEVEFAELQITPRLLALPLPRAQWSQTNVAFTAYAAVADAAIPFTIGGNGINGSQAVLPTGTTNGDIFKVIIDSTNSTISALSTMRVKEQGGYVAVAIQDGTTVYAVYNGAVFYLYPNAAAAYAYGGAVLSFNTTTSLTANMQCWFSLIGSVGTLNLNPNF